MNPINRTEITDATYDDKTGTIRLSNGDYLSVLCTTGIFQQAQKADRVLLLNFPADGPTEMRDAAKSLAGAADAKDRDLAITGLGQAIRGVSDFLGVGTPIMQAPANTIKTDGLPAAGLSGVTVLRDFRAESYSAGLQVDADQLQQDSTTLDYHYQVQGLLNKGVSRVTRGISYMTTRVFGGVSLVYKAIGGSLPLNEALQTAADDMVSYFGDTKALGQKTRKLVDKTTQTVTDKVTKNVQAQALAQARQEVRAEIESKVESSSACNRRPRPCAAAWRSTSWQSACATRRRSRASRSTACSSRSIRSCCSTARG